MVNLLILNTLSKERIPQQNLYLPRVLLALRDVLRGKTQWENMYVLTLLSVWNYNKVLKFESHALVEQWEYPHSIVNVKICNKSETKYTLIRHNGSTVMICVDDLKWWVGLKLMKIRKDFDVKFFFFQN